MNSNDFDEIAKEANNLLTPRKSCDPDKRTNGHI